MMICAPRFNIYLLAALCLVMVCGCSSSDYARKRQLSTIRVHLEVNSDATGHSQIVQVYREHPVSVSIEKEPFLTEANVSEAKIEESLGGFSIRIKFDRQGTWLLEQYSSANPGRHFAIFSQFVNHPGEKVSPGRWLAAPQIPQRIKDGVLTFTPDATREETANIVLGL